MRYASLAIVEELRDAIPLERQWWRNKNAGHLEGWWKMLNIMVLACKGA